MYLLYSLQNELGHAQNRIQGCKSFVGKSVDKSGLETLLDV